MNRLFAVKRVADYRALKAWTPAADIRDFCQYNVVFGVNGSGKSTFASLLAEASSDSSWSTGLSVSVALDDQAPRDVSGATDPFWSCLRVFNSDYVNKNLRFADDGGSTTEPLLVLGEARVEAEAERAAATARLAEIAQELPTIERSKQVAETKRDRLATNTARTITEELQGASAKYAPRSYNARAVRQLVQTGVAPDAHVDVAKELRVARETPPPKCSIPSARTFSIAEQIDEVKSLLAEKALSVVIKELAERPDWSRWVESGIALHDGQDRCIFCGSDISDERRHALEAHFDESLQLLQSRIDTMSRTLEGLRGDASVTVTSLAQPEAIVEEFRVDYKQELDVVNQRLKKLTTSVDGLIQGLNDKRDNLFTALSLSADPEVADLTLEKAVSLIEKHNTHVDEHDTHRTSAAERVERERVAAIASEYIDLDSEASNAGNKAEELKGERTRLERDLKKATNVDLDPLPLAERLTQDLSHLLGRGDLTFSSEEGGYRIMRDGLPATHLSEGERNAISLLYFLRSLETHDTDTANCVVLIDDPVSSLDQNSLVGASALLWARLVGRCGQLIMLTHNFELFRTWSFQLSHSGPATKPFGLYEMRSSVVVDGHGKRRREPALVNWPYDDLLQRRLRSEYHYLFWTVLHTLGDCERDLNRSGKVAGSSP